MKNKCRLQEFTHISIPPKVIQILFSKLRIIRKIKNVIT